MKKYTALIVDIKNSRKYSLQVRNDLQEYIMHVIKVLNNIFFSVLEKNVYFSAGDEIQGLFTSVEASFLYYRLFSMLIAPIEIRAGIGVGEWSVRINDAGTTAQDGEAYHNARYAINSTEDSLGYSVLLFSGKKDDTVVNSLLNSTALIISKQSEYQNEIMLLSELLYPINTNEIINVDTFKKITELLEHKSYTVKQIPKHKLMINRESLFNRISYFEIIPNPIDAFISCNSFFVTDGRIRGLPKKLSEIMGVTRQSIYKTIKTANIYEARNLAVATLRYLRNWSEEQ